MPDGRADAPVLDAYDVGHGVCVVWCTHCCLWHFHGSRNTAVHVAAHCAWMPPSEASPDYPGDSPYFKTGYWLNPVGPATPEILLDMRSMPPRGPARLQ
jgi:hypothetical protein